jgi:hypothetical protein
MARNYTIENAEIFWKNFEGREKSNNGKIINNEGQRNFCVYIPEDDAEAMAADGWNIKYSKPREDGDVPRPYLQVAVRYGAYPPKIYKVTSRNKTLLSEDVVGDLDRDEITHVDLIMNGSEWEPGRIKAYCKTMYVTIAEDFGGRYADYDEVGDLPFEE